MWTAENTHGYLLLLCSTRYCQDKLMYMYIQVDTIVLPVLDKLGLSSLSDLSNSLDSSH